MKFLIILCFSLGVFASVEFIYYRPSSDKSDVLQTQPMSNYADHEVLDFRFSPPPIAQLRAITDRPLFTPTRRQAALIIRSPIEAFRLRGVVLSKRHNTALVERRSDGVLLRLREGDHVDEWQITFIDADAIGFSGSEESYAIKISDTIEDRSPHELVERAIEEEERIGSEIADVDTREEFNPVWHIHASEDQASNRRLRSRSGAKTTERRDMNYPTAVPVELPPPPPQLLPRDNRTRRS